MTAIQARPATAKKNTTEEKGEADLGPFPSDDGLQSVFRVHVFFEREEKKPRLSFRQFKLQLSEAKPLAVLQVGFREGVKMPIQDKICWI